MKLFSKTITFAAILTLLISVPSIRADTVTSKDVRERNMHYTCRLSTGEVIVTTDRQVAEDPAVGKARVFAEKTQYGPMPVFDVGTTTDPEEKGKLKFFEEVIVEELSKTVWGWESGTARTVTIVAGEQKEVPVHERNMRLARVKTAPREAVYAKENFKAMTGSPPEVDAPVYTRPELRGRVVSVDEKEVRVTFSPLSKEPLAGPFGPIRVREEGDLYVIEIDAKEGTLVRVGPLVGRIAEVDPKMFRIDYSHPFGGKTLYCDVRIQDGPARIPKSGNERIAVAGDLPEKDDVEKGTKDSKQSVTSEKDGSNTGAAPDEDPNTAQTGDLLELHYTASLESGELIRTSLRSVAEDPGIKKFEVYLPPGSYGPEAVVLGTRASFPGLGTAPAGMRPGEEKQVTLPQEKAYGPRDIKWIGEYERVRSIPKTVTMSAETYVNRFGGFPKMDRKVTYNPYVEARVTNVGDKNVTMELVPKFEKDETEMGTTEVKSLEKTIQISLTPKIGGPFQFKGRTGRIVSVDVRRFTVDFNHPLAGKPVVLKMKLLSLVKASAFEKKHIAWIEDHDQGLDAAVKEKKPVILVLYASWCKWSRRLLNESLKDPRIKMLSDRFVWIRVDSHKQKDLKEFYEQKSFPAVVLMDPDGTVFKTLKGYMGAGDLKKELMELTEHCKSGPEKVTQTVRYDNAAVSGNMR